MVNVSAVLGQPLAVAITEMVAVMGAVPLFTGVNAGMFVFPFAPNPIAELELVHAYVVPVTVFVKGITDVKTPLQ
jgi:hypothetical protein